MHSFLVSHTTGPLDGINFYFHELEGLCVALASLCMVVYAVYHALKKRKAANETS